MDTSHATVIFMLPVIFILSGIDANGLRLNTSQVSPLPMVDMRENNNTNCNGSIYVCNEHVDKFTNRTSFDQSYADNSKNNLLSAFRSMPRIGNRGKGKIKGMNFSTEGIPNCSEHGAIGDNCIKRATYLKNVNVEGDKGDKRRPRLPKNNSKDFLENSSDSSATKLLVLSSRECGTNCPNNKTLNHIGKMHVDNDESTKPSSGLALTNKDQSLQEWENKALNEILTGLSQGVTEAVDNDTNTIEQTEEARLEMDVIQRKKRDLDEVDDIKAKLKKLKSTVKKVNYKGDRITTSGIDPKAQEDSRDSEEERKEVQKMLRGVGMYLLSHKILEVDWRYIQEEEGKTTEEQRVQAQKVFADHFPSPALRKIHTGVQRECEKGFYMCLDEIYKMYLRSKMSKPVPKGRRGGFRSWFSGQLLEKDVEVDAYSPFRSPLKQFQYRASASYYMCWYSMHMMPQLRSFGQRCERIRWGRHEHQMGYEYRADDSVPFGCALFSFCPDPCCGHLKSADMSTLNPSDCYTISTNPCRQVANGKCTLETTTNTNFRDLISNRINYTCGCNEQRAGFEWNIPFKRCVDKDECYDDEHQCGEGEVCRNTVGGYDCVCRRGFGARNGSCVLEFHVDEEETEEGTLYLGPEHPEKQTDLLEELGKSLDKGIASLVSNLLIRAGSLMGVPSPTGGSEITTSSALLVTICCAATYWLNGQL